MNVQNTVSKLSTASLDLHQNPHQSFAPDALADGGYQNLTPSLTRFEFSGLDIV